MRWEPRRIGDLCMVGRGSSPRPINDQRFFENGDIPWVKVADATASGKYLYETKLCVNKYGASYSRLLPAGSLIICTSGTLGLPIILGVDGCIHDGWLYTNNYKGLDPEFFYYFLQTQRDYFASVAYGAAIQNINTEILRSTEIRLPPESEQARIAMILKSYDDLIENNRRRMALLEESARLLYREWFVRLRFPGYEHTPIVDGVPQGWERKTLGNSVTLNYGKALKAEVRIEGSYPVYGSSGIVGTHEKPLVQGPAIILGRKGNVGSVYWSSKSFYPIDTVYFVTPEFSSLYLFYALKNMHFISTDVAVPGLNRNFAYSRLLLHPPVMLLHSFHETVVPLHEQLDKLDEQNQKLRAARDLLLPRLMSGDLAV